MLRMELSGKRKRGRPKRRFMNGHGSCGSDGRRRWEQMEMENLLWRDLTGEAERKIIIR